MKKCIYLSLLYFLVSAASAQSVHNLSLNTIDGTSVSFSSYAGKKIVVIIASVNEMDTLFLNELLAFTARYHDSVQVIAVPSREDGYNDSNKTKLKNFYQSLASNILLADGVFIKKSSGNNQSALFKWLTHQEENHRFNNEALGQGHKFFIDESGKLYSVLSPQVPLLSYAVERDMQRKNEN